MKGVHTRMKKRKRIYIFFCHRDGWRVLANLFLSSFSFWKNSHAGTQQGQQQRKTRRGIGRDGVVIDISTTKWWGLGTSRAVFFGASWQTDTHR
jgi:hypothetical protein